MGYAIANAAVESGAEVTVISGPTHLDKNPRVQFIHVQTAQQMYQATLEQLGDADIFIAAAAVADYTPIDPASQKLTEMPVGGIFFRSTVYRRR